MLRLLIAVLITLATINVIGGNVHLPLVYGLQEATATATLDPFATATPIAPRRRVSISV